MSRDRPTKQQAAVANATAGRMPERPLTLRLPEELVRQVDDLLPHVGGDLSYAALGRVSRSQVLRIALLEGVKLLRQRYQLDGEPPTGPTEGSDG